MRYLQSALLVGAALALALVLGPYLPYPFLFPFLASVMASAWFGGPLPGLFAVFLSSAVVDYFFIPPIHRFAISLPELPYLCAFVISAALAAWLSAARRTAEASLRQARDQLELRVEERTRQLRQSDEALRAAQAELAHATRVMTMGEVVVSIAHEFSQPLVGVITNAGAGLRWLESESQNVDEARAAMRRILRDGNRARDVLAQVRSLIRKAEPKKTVIDLHAALADVITVVESELRRQQVSLRFEPMAQWRWVMADRVQIQQVILNLMLNAIEGMRESDARARQLWIRTRDHGADEIAVAVEDSGPGIAPEDRERVFDAFFTTKSDGLGMGLSISRSIVEAHRGRLWASSEPGRGATLQFTLPVASSSPEDER
ncbi:MAG: sensor histidine kinase [Myxococcota bacterium]